LNRWVAKYASTLASAAQKRKLPTVAAEQGDAFAQNNLDRIEQDSQGALRYYTEGVKWYRLAAEQGNEAAQNSLDPVFHDDAPTRAQIAVQYCPAEWADFVTLTPWAQDIFASTITLSNVQTTSDTYNRYSTTALAIASYIGHFLHLSEENLDEERLMQARALFGLTGCLIPTADERNVTTNPSPETMSEVEAEKSSSLLTHSMNSIVSV